MLFNQDKLSWQQVWPDETKVSRLFSDLPQLITKMVMLILLLLHTSCPFLANSGNPDKLASEEANWSGSALFVIKYVNFYQKPGSSNLIGWKLEVGVVS